MWRWSATRIRDKDTKSRILEDKKQSSSFIDRWKNWERVESRSEHTKVL